MNQVFPDEKQKYLEKHLVGVCSDRGSNMISKKDAGINNRLKALFDHIVVAQDVSHLFNSVSKQALSKFPAESLSLIKNVCAHFARSSHRRDKLQDIQKRFSEDDTSFIYQMISYNDIRWTSWKNATDRILMLWEHIEQYANENKEVELSNLTAQNQAYLTLLQCVLDKLHALVVFFENENYDYGLIIPKLQRVLVTWSHLLFRDETLGFNTVYTIPLESQLDKDTWLKSRSDFETSFKEKYGVFRAYEDTLGKEFMTKLYGVAWDFLFEAFISMRELLPFKDKLLLACEVLSLKKFDITKWCNLALEFPQVISPSERTTLQHQLEIFGEELKELKTLYENEEKKVAFWNKLSNEFSLIKKLALTLITLPYSTVGIERTFSILRDVKTSKRNRLTPESVEAILLIKTNLQELEDFKVDDSMIEKYKVMWKSGQQKQKDKAKKDRLLKILETTIRFQRISEVRDDYIMNGNGKKRKAIQPKSATDFDQSLKFIKLSNSQ